jgi:hypothetical protein
VPGPNLVWPFGHGFVGQRITLRRSWSDPRSQLEVVLILGVRPRRY